MNLYKEFVFMEVPMNATHDALYQVHQVQAQRRGRPCLSYEEFRARLHETYETDLTGLLLPAPGAALQFEVNRGPKFTLGQLRITPAVADAVPAHEVIKALARHSAGDWGELDRDTWVENDKALSKGGRLLSAYQASNGQKFWVITEADRVTTTVLLPEDY
jgi:hypothetical protein